MKSTAIVAGAVLAVAILIVAALLLMGNVGAKDTDGDGHTDANDAFPNNPTQWADTDHDGFGDNPDGSSADDFVSDATQWSDADGDGFGDNSDNSYDSRFWGGVPYQYLRGKAFFRFWPLRKMRFLN